MGYANGRLPDSALTKIAGTCLADGTANAFRAWQVACAREGIILDTWGEASGYRDYDMQGDMRHAFVSRNAAEMARFHMDSTSRITPAAPGYSNHGWGIAVDIRSNNRDKAFAIGKRFGFTQVFGWRDANHALHDGRTAIAAPKPAKAPAKATTVAAPKPAAKPTKGPAKPGKSIATVQNGKPTGAYWRRVHWLARVRGGYAGPILATKPTPTVWRHVQVALDVPHTGKLDSDTVKAMQRKANSTAYVSVHVDGIIGAYTVRGFAKWLNTL